MGRPRLPVGTAGKIRTSKQDNGQWRARAGFRDPDGVVRDIERYAPTKTAAENALKAAIRDRARTTGSVGINGDMLVRDLAAEWLDRVDRRDDLAIGTKQQYRRCIDANILPAFPQLRVGEATVPLVDAALQAINERNGHGVAKTARTCMSGMFGLAVRQQAIASNPVRDTERLTGKSRKKPRSLDFAQVDYLLEHVAGMKLADMLDLVDLMQFMLLTGCRIGEALACREGRNADGEPLIDYAAGTWEINATIVRVKGRGLVVQERTKTQAGWRVIALPPAAVELLQRRRTKEMLRPHTVTVLDGGGKFREQSVPVMFPSPGARSLRDPNNTQGDLRLLLDMIDCDDCQGTGYALDPADETKHLLNEKGHRIRCDQGSWSWVTSHTFRKTVATLMEEAGCTPRQVADHLGHSKPSMTMDVYFGRGVVVAAAAHILDRKLRQVA